MALSVRPDVLANRHLLSTFPKCFFSQTQYGVYSFKTEGDLLGTSCFVGYFSNIENTKKESFHENVCPSVNKHQGIFMIFYRNVYKVTTMCPIQE